MCEDSIMKDALLLESVRSGIAASARKSTYVIGSSMIVLVNPSGKDLAQVSPELKDSVIVIEGSPLSLGLAMDAMIKCFFMPILEELEGASGVENASVLDLSATAGLFSVMASVMGASQVRVVSDDAVTVRKNLSQNKCRAKVIPRSKLSGLKNLDLVVHDLSFIPSMKVLSQHRGRLREGGVLAVVGLLGQQIPMLTRELASMGLEPISHRWLDEQCLMLLKKAGKVV